MDGPLLENPCVTTAIMQPSTNGQVMATPKEILDTAASLVSYDRAKVHGDYTRSLSAIAAYWNVYMMNSGRPPTFTAHDVAVLMALLKIARVQTSDSNGDNYIDIAGYAALAGAVHG